MQSLPHNRRYGLIILAAILGSLLWVVLDNQEASTDPGLLAPLRRQVWCQTIVQVSGESEDEGQLLILNHYPGKKLRRVMEDFGFPEQAIRTWLGAEKKSLCFNSWREAALSDFRFGDIMKGYEPVIAEWPEATFKEALLTLTFQPNGEEIVKATLYRQAEALEKENREQGVGSHP